MFSLFRKDGQNRPDQCLAPEDQLPAECHFVNSGDEAAGGAPRPESDGAAGTVLAVQATDCPPVSDVSSEGSGTAAVDATPMSELADRPSSGLVADQEAEPACEPHGAPAETASADEATGERDPAAEELAGLSGRQRRRRLKGRRLARPEQATAGRHASFTPEQRLLLLDTWLRSGLPAKDFAALVGISKHTLYKWKQLFEDQGPAGLADPPRTARRGSRLPEVTKRTILMLKQQHPEWGCQRISDLLARGPALPASASAVARVLHEAGYESVQELTRPHPPKKCRFERARPNQLWQTDLFTFVLKRQNRRLYMVAFLDDHSRFLVSYGLHASASTALVLEVLEAGITAWGPPEEILTDNGPQYVTWRGKSRFSRHLEKRGIRQIVARPRRPQTLGKIERFWGTMWREFLETAVFRDLAEARERIGHFIDYYNLQRPHRSLEGLVPADRFFGAAPDVLATLKQRARANALELARFGRPKTPFYVTGLIDGQSFSVHAEGQRLVLRKQGEQRREIELAGSAEGGSPPVEPTELPVTAEPPVSEASSTAAGTVAEPAADPGEGEDLPAPLCPRAAPADRAGEPACEPPAAPGQSVLDEEQLWKQLDEAAKPQRPALPDDSRQEGGRS